MSSTFIGEEISTLQRNDTLARPDSGFCVLKNYRSVVEMIVNNAVVSFRISSLTSLSLCVGNTDSMTILRLIVHISKFCIVVRA